GRTPWMLGDDLTDEDAFRHVNASGGISVIVGARRPTEARYALDDPAAVRAWLHALATRPAHASASGSGDHGQIERR
ncbi:MAG: trehalose-phosphatase, partial [Xanthomonadaceae bacterium]|nr:trehalose-phosphatase [Xanthomonadaceae bacterium]